LEGAQIVNKKVVAIVQARMNSSRLPGKVLMPILGRPMLDIQMQRLLPSKEIDDILIATSDQDSDNPLASFCCQNGYSFYRGELNDVLDRYVQTADETDADIIVRITGDCPLVHHGYVDAMIRTFIYNDLCYASNGFIEYSNTPDGFDVEILTRKTLDKLNIYSLEREHPTKDIWFRPAFYGKTLKITMPEIFYNRKLSVDTIRDFMRVKSIFETIGRVDFDLYEIINTMNWR
jgi:spore coat polysaccharide biosynthesis protein SpsF